MHELCLFFFLEPFHSFTGIIKFRSVQEQIGNNLPDGFGISKIEGIIYEGGWLNGNIMEKGN